MRLAPSSSLTGWLFDCYPGPGGIVVWLVDERGRGTPFGRLRRLEVRWEGRTLVLEEGEPAALLAELNRLLDEVDPHVLVTRPCPFPTEERDGGVRDMQNSQDHHH